MWFRYAQEKLDSLEEEAQKTTQQVLKKEHEEEMPLLTDIQGPNEIAQYVAKYMENAVRNFSATKGQNNWYYPNEIIYDLQNKLRIAADKALKEASIFDETLYNKAQKSLNEAFENTLNFRGLVNHFIFNSHDSKAEPKIESLSRYKYEFCKVFRYLFLSELIKNVFRDSKKTYYPFYTHKMKEWSPETQDALYQGYI